MKKTSILVACVLAGCASLDRDECRNADWYAIGLEDGARGRAVERLGSHRRACAEHGVAPQTERYLAGRKEGLKSFCTYERGYSEGRGGHGYSGACPDEIAGGFLAGYQRGRELYELNRRLDATRKEISRIKAAVTEGIPNPRSRAMELERLEARTREAEQLEQQIRSLQ